ncbi:MAG: vitamin K epoxide reductase family protein [Ferruginibacter sp.]
MAVVFYNQKSWTPSKTNCILAVDFNLLIFSVPHNSPASTELWQTGYQWLRELGVDINKNFCRQEITAHPDYPALTALTDFLQVGGMDYQAVQADASYINEFNYPLLAHIKVPGREHIQIINEPADWDKQKEITQHWSGVVIYPDEASNWYNNENSEYVKKENRNKAKSYLLLAAALVILIVAIAYNPTLVFGFMGLLSLAGLVVSLLITGTEIGVQNNIVKQVCGAVSSGGCGGVLKTHYAKAIAGFTIGDISVIYFGSQFSTVFLSILHPPLFNAIFLFCLPGLVVAGWSIYTQAVQIKQWCGLCLAIVALLILQFFMAASYIYPLGFNSLLDIPAIMFFAGLATLLSLVLYPVKKMFITNFSNAQKVAELKNWKMDGDLFLAQWEREQTVDTSLWENELLIGNPEAPVKLTVTCNPYCGPCATAHKELEKMMHKYKNTFCVQVRFLCVAANEKDKTTIAVKAILQKAREVSKENIAEMLSDWFKYMNYETWILKWKTSNMITVAPDLEKHQDWIKENDIQFTPTFFLNGKKLPSRYSLQDLEELVPQLAMEFAERHVK